MVQEEAIEQLIASLKTDHRVQALFVKGSIGRGEHDEYSDIDLYCMVEEKDQEVFLQKRLDHLRTYRELLFYDDIFIIAPQVIAVYDNLLHVDLFTVTEESFIEKDFFKVYYDPKGLLSPYQASQHLQLSPTEFLDNAMDTVWFLFQYRKAQRRGNHLWAVDMLHQVMLCFSKVLLHHYSSDRAQLGLKTLERFLPLPILKQVQEIFNQITLKDHTVAASLIVTVLKNELEWMFSQLEEPEKLKPFAEKLLSSFKK
ncbi:putative nucleotidyltransferase [Pullulanibacillus pueri]|uniref:Polymerase nucleotidyl transferase domain-containing protein n=1 Tax=Pullulanibacillus pueri TaxID=1437324 RepID=A0A8J2ZVG6_9BACL|nr:nucleotidyltransferase domain-containing protein [Pullulanibacillus pueri]MBM7681642.1 putative nucleotidyltransferase [Pullulanibacillus pueri]GGH79338.1 hypothetical protein GCM10007096_14110 [Pullulanibacillus pueri]